MSKSITVSLGNISCYSSVHQTLLSLSTTGPGGGEGVGGGGGSGGGGHYDTSLNDTQYTCDVDSNGRYQTNRIYVDVKNSVNSSFSALDNPSSMDLAVDEGRGMGLDVHDGRERDVWRGFRDMQHGAYRSRKRYEDDVFRGEAKDEGIPQEGRGVDWDKWFEGEEEEERGGHAYDDFFGVSTGGGEDTNKRDTKGGGNLMPPPPPNGDVEGTNTESADNAWNEAGGAKSVNGWGSIHPSRTVVMDYVDVGVHSTSSKCGYLSLKEECGKVVEDEAWEKIRKCLEREDNIEGLHMDCSWGEGTGWVALGEVLGVLWKDECGRRPGERRMERSDSKSIIPTE